MCKLLLALPLLAAPLLAGCGAPGGGSELARLHLAPPVGTDPREACVMGPRDPELCQREDEARHRAEKAEMRAAYRRLGLRELTDEERGGIIPPPPYAVDEDKLVRDRAEARVRAAAWRVDGDVAGAEARPSLYTPPLSSPLHWPGGYALARGRLLGRR